MTYDVDYFIAKFEAIPEEKWCKYCYTDGDRHCALGHCGVSPGSGAGDEAMALYTIFSPLSVTAINDADYHPYTQPTPKQRILAALRDIKAKGCPHRR